MPEVFRSDSFNTRLRESISVAWSIFMRKLGYGIIEINKEASMQLQYAYILQQVLPLLTYHKNEEVKIELETGVQLNGATKEIDLLLSGVSAAGETKIAIEMKCYRTIASSGGKRGATDIFMKDVYEDLQLLEHYIEAGHANQGISLMMNDMDNFVNPRSKQAKCWDYDISQGATFSNIHLTTPIGGKNIDITLKRKYEIIWEQHGGFWFTEIEGKA
jgi:hypothetical protein